MRVALLAALCLFGCAGSPAESGSGQATAETLSAPVYQVNCGGPAVGSFAADEFATGGNSFSSATAVATAGVANAAPSLVYQSDRYGNHSYSFGSLTPGAGYIVRLHFAEIYFTTAGSRVFNVAINGTQVLSNLDIFVAAGGANKALVRDFTSAASSSGQIVIQYTSVVDNAKSSGIEIIPSGSAPAQTLTSINVTPGSAQLATGGTQQFRATALDQTGSPMATQPSFSWAVTGGGTISSSGLLSASTSGSFTVNATSGSVHGSASIVISAQAPPPGTAVYRVNCGGPAVGTFAGDEFATGGNSFSSATAVTTAGVANAAPSLVYQAERYGNHSYTFGSLTPGASYTVRLHFAEIYFTTAGSRIFNVAVNSTQVLTNLDIFAVAGANKALVYDFTAAANGSGQIVIQYTSVVDNAKSSGIEIISSGAAAPPPAPTLTSIRVAPGTAQVAVNGSQKFVATGLDQSGSSLSPQPTFTWAVTGGGTVDSTGLFRATSSGSFVVTAASGGKSGSANVTVTSGTSGTPGPNDVAVNSSDVHQRIDGFGASDKYATLTDAQADLFFSQTSGIGLSILRIAVDPAGVDISPYANAQKAAARGAIVWASPWSPPAVWKDNGSTGNGGQLLVADYDAWASRLAGFAATLQQNGVTLYGISAQNEPDYTASWDSCIYSSDQMIAFIKVLGPKLAALSPRPKLISPEASNWGALWGYGDAILQDATASSFTDILATHDYTYGTPTHAAISKPIWETEVSSFDGPSTDIGNGLTVASWIHRALVTGSVSAWHYWWLVGRNGDNEGLLNPGGVTTKRLYVLGNFSKFVRPGYNLVGITGPVPAGLSVSAYLNPANGAIVIVCINPNGSTPISLFVPGSHASATPWVTSASDDLAAKSAIAVNAGRFATTLGAQSVTTFVVP